MAVKIKGFDIPDTCYVCKFNINGYCLLTDKKAVSDERPDWCLLEEIPHVEESNIIQQEYVNEIIEYLNYATGAKYKASTPKTITLIKARFKEGFTIEDFKTVIDKKARAWNGNEKMQKYLRPETLFGTKFEGYLNEQETYKLKGNSAKKESSFQRIQRLMQEGAFDE